MKLIAVPRAGCKFCHLNEQIWRTVFVYEQYSSKNMNKKCNMPNIALLLHLAVFYSSRQDGA